jgi:S1-C subfamily serine protease
MHLAATFLDRVYVAPALARGVSGALPCGTMRWRWLTVTAALLALTLTGCERAAEMIPGHDSTPTPRAAATPGAIQAPPLLAPGSLRLAGSAGAAADRASVPDAELGKTLMVVQTLDAGGKTLRNGGGVFIDRQQQLILTSYQLVQPYRADGTRAYASIGAGPAATGNLTPELEVVLVSATPQFDVAVLRVVGLREGMSPPPAATEAALADSAGLRRGDQLRFLAQPSVSRAAPIQVTNATVTGFSGNGAGEARAFLKTDARLVGGAVGSPVFDVSGSLVGFATQLSYDPAAPVALVRPLAKAIDALNEARTAPTTTRYSAPLQHPPSLSGATTADAAVDGVVVGRPVFAESALEGPGFRDLFDITNIFKQDSPELDYEYIAQGIPQGALVQELWYLNGVLQDSLSSSYSWSKGSFAIVTDRLTTPSARGVPSGTWTIEVWVAGTVRASASAYVGITPPEVPRKPQASGFKFASTASPEQMPGAEAVASAGQIMMFFDYQQAAAVQTVRWIVLHDGRTVYQSPSTPWYGGDHGIWWVGAPADGAAIGGGNWEIQLYFDNLIAGSLKATLR